MINWLFNYTPTIATKRDKPPEYYIFSLAKKCFLSGGQAGWLAGELSEEYLIYFQQSSRLAPAGLRNSQVDSALRLPGNSGYSQENMGNSGWKTL